MFTVISAFHYVKEVTSSSMIFLSLFYSSLSLSIIIYLLFSFPLSPSLSNEYMSELLILFDCFSFILIDLLSFFFFAMSYRYRCRLYCTPSGPERENKKKNNNDWSLLKSIKSVMMVGFS